MPLKQIFLDTSSKQFLEKLNNLEINQKVASKNPNYDKIKEILDIGRQNALIYLQRKHLGEKLNIYEENNLFKILLILQKILNLSKVPRKIECYDISHLSGKFVYGSMIVFVDGKPQKKFYRLFKTKEQNNDFENHKEVLSRRFERSLEYYLAKKNLEQNPEKIVKK